MVRVMKRNSIAALLVFVVAVAINMSVLCSIPHIVFAAPNEQNVQSDNVQQKDENAQEQDLMQTMDATEMLMVEKEKTQVFEKKNKQLYNCVIILSCVCIVTLAAGVFAIFGYFKTREAYNLLDREKRELNMVKGQLMQQNAKLIEELNEYKTGGK